MIKEVKKQHGFTIVELLIATSVFTVILLLVSVGIIKINANYYKGVNQSRTQQTARAVLDDISQAIQFNNGAVSAPSSPFPSTEGDQFAVCVGGNRYSVYLKKMIIADSSTSHALIKDTPGSCAIGDPVDNLDGGGALPSGTTELLAPRMRVAALSVEQPNSTDSSGLWKVNVRIVYGGDGVTDDLLNGSKDGCNTGEGSQFCAVSDLTAYVEKRL